MDDQDVAERLKIYLKARKDQNSRYTHIGDNDYSISELYDHVDKGTEIGKGLVASYGRFLIRVGKCQQERMPV